MSSFFNGMLFALLIGLVGWVLFAWPTLDVVIAIVIVINMVLVGLASASIPVILERLGIDPALASGTFVTTVTDVGGFLTFLGLASFVLI
ncbi:MAG: magnesium transporter [Aestuariivita sp.]|nr:magnesium transporter [Aestuariivita sp.]